ncbi:MAG: hypothetical protein KDA97_05280 [Acidimicrobiales bacterium]|nr:hypothetical protein [Acidimicrobiales bacterium]
MRPQVLHQRGRITDGRRDHIDLDPLASLLGGDRDPLLGAEGEAGEPDRLAEDDHHVRSDLRHEVQLPRSPGVERRIGFDDLLVDDGGDGVVRDLGPRLQERRTHQHRLVVGLDEHPGHR